MKIENKISNEYELKIDNIQLIKDYKLFYNSKSNDFYIYSKIDDFSLSSDKLSELFHDMNEMILE